MGTWSKHGDLEYRKVASRSKSRLVAHQKISRLFMTGKSDHDAYVIDAVRSSRILIGKQKLGVTFNSDKLGGIDFTKFSKLTMCSA